MSTHHLHAVGYRDLLLRESYQEPVRTTKQVTLGSERQVRCEIIVLMKNELNTVCNPNTIAVKAAISAINRGS